MDGVAILVWQAVCLGDGGMGIATVNYIPDGILRQANQDCGLPVLFATYELPSANPSSLAGAICDLGGASRRFNLDPVAVTVGGFAVACFEMA